MVPLDALASNQPSRCEGTTITAQRSSTVQASLRYDDLCATGVRPRSFRGCLRIDILYGWFVLHWECGSAAVSHVVRTCFEDYLGDPSCHGMRLKGLNVSSARGGGVEMLVWSIADVRGHSSEVKSLRASTISVLEPQCDLHVFVP